MAFVRIPFTFDRYQSAKEAGLHVLRCNGSMMDVLHEDRHAVESWITSYSISTPLEHIMMKPRLKRCHAADATALPHSSGTSYFTMTQLRSIYNIPLPSTSPYVVGVISFGGGLYGTVDSYGILTNGDVQAYWSSIGIAPENHPRVVVVPLFGATNTPDINDGGSTIENTIDVEAIGGACPSSLLTILLYIAPNTLDQFAPMLQYIYSRSVVVNGVNYKPNLLSCSWGAPELYYTPLQLASIHSALSTLSNAGISMCVATGDNGSNDGVGGNSTYVDYPSADPYSTAVGGSHLVCPNYVYDSSTVETAWSSGGGGVSSIYAKPAYQAALSGTRRSIPDVACLADPNTGVYFTINGSSEVVGGTSIAAPTFAGFLASIHCNIFINPLLYQVAALPSSGAFHDLTSGSNGAYSAHAGYDDCTGWGSFNGIRLVTAMASLQSTLPSPIYVTSITLSSTTITLPVNQVAQLTATIAPSNVTTSTLLWSSSQPSIATISSTGLITALRAGTTTISVKSTDGSNITSLATVTVTPLVNIPVSSVVLNQSSATLRVGSTLSLIPTISPSNATDPSVIWSSTQPSVATVSSSGVITALSSGSTTIKVTTTSGSFKAFCLVTVVMPVTSVAIVPSSVSMGMGTTRQLIAMVYPSNATNKAVTWTSSDTTIVTVSSSGMLTSKTHGVATITVQTAEGGYTATTHVSVVTGVQSVRLNTPNLSLPINGTFQLQASLSPPSAPNQHVTWSSSRSSVATVTSTGLITARSRGTATITVRTDDGNLSTFIFVHVA